ncbi:hypothetical protein SORA22_04000 [Streptococcus oralis]
MKKYIDYLDLFARVVVILMSLFLCIRVLMISTELWKNIVVLVSTPVTIYSLIKHRLDYKVYKNKERS